MDSIILASGSQRRADILQSLDIPFTRAPQDIDETFTGEDPFSESMRLSRGKLAALFSGWTGSPPWALAADTFIRCGGIFLGKPENRGKAGEMLTLLAGRSHDVITGLALHSPEFGITTAASLTKVFFGQLTQKEIEEYLDIGEWRDAAGAYQIQGKGAFLIDRIEGSYSNVMGLPIRTFYGMLRHHKYISVLSGGEV